MSIKTKLAGIILILITLILVLNNSLHYFSTKTILKENQEKLLELTAKEFSIAIGNSREGATYIENLVGTQLRIAALVAKYALDPDIENVTNEELVQLSEEIGISHISLFKKVEELDDIVPLKSSDPEEIGVGSKEWGYWYEAFEQLLAGEEVTVSEGQVLPNYWTGPFDVSSSNPDHVDKWGYFYDGTTNYIIDPYVRDNQMLAFDEITGIRSFLDQTLQDNEVILEVSGFNPEAFGREPIITKTNDVEYIRLGNRPLIFGEYQYINEEQDMQYIHEALKQGEIISYEAILEDKRVMKSFYPVMEETPYVIGLVTDYKIIQEVLNEQLFNNLMISLCILLIVFLISYLVSRYSVKPIYHILSKVNDISNGHFGEQVVNKRKDELGLLSAGINTMSKNLKTYTEQIKYQAEHDSLTNLANRRSFNTFLKTEIEKAKAAHTSIALMFLDLDRFKSINDLYGHSIGDLLLINVAQALEECIGTRGKVFRIGGDEFTIILPESHAEIAKNIGQQILSVLSQPFMIEGNDVFITSSIGVSIYPSNGTSVESLLKNADIAMYRAKEKGKNMVEIFSLELDKEISKKIIIERDLRHALENDELELYYQPKMSLHTRDITGIEALLRWDHPQFGMISPLEFIPLAEEAGLIEELGVWVLKTACRQNKSWQKRGLPSLRVSVNLSARQFKDQNLLESIVQILDDTQLDPQYLELEITEHIAMQNVDCVTTKLQELKDLGIHISLDDFGTGYSSLSYLQKFPIDTLKIDKSFIGNIASHNEDNITIITAIISMAHHLGMNVVAEGVETKEQYLFLEEEKCDAMQGYFLSKPLHAQEFEQMYISYLEAAPGPEDR